jgi:hypothetical protein
LTGKENVAVCCSEFGLAFIYNNFYRKRREFVTLVTLVTLVTVHAQLYIAGLMRVYGKCDAVATGEKREVMSIGFRFLS